ncbi:MAG: hypothetical protein PF569_07860 [Candidatus Woesearchaeota archaeon]|jgi:hypothetical protein|nr:hypothetical protein [Candidatus Woesearchaeota archaeon]
MSRNIYIKIFSSIFFITFLLVFAHAAYPEFEFDTTSYNSGAVDVILSASSGTKVDLFINENFIGSQNVYASSNIVHLDGSEILDEEVSIFSKIIFINEDPSSVYIINISSGPYKRLLYGQNLEFEARVVEDISYTNEETGVSRTISVVDELVDVYFNNSAYNTNDYMGDGLNSFKFIQSYPATSYSTSEEFVFDVDFNKFSNMITLINTTPISSDRDAYFAGYVSDSRYPLYYSINTAPAEISNLAGLTQIVLDGADFEVSMSNLREGNNTIYFLSVDNVQTDVFSGETIDFVVVDTVDPIIRIVQALYSPIGESYDLNADFSDDVFINGKKLTLEIVSDSVILNYTFNDKEDSEEVEGENVTINLNLNEGQNNLTLLAIDSAGNFNKVQHNIYYSGSKPKLIKETLEPAELFDSHTAHFFFEKISGKTTVPDVEMTIFTIPPKAVTIDDKAVTCEDFEFLFFQNLGQLDRDRVDSVEVNMNETQLSFLNFILQKETVTSGSDGSFDAIVTFKEDSFGVSDLREAGTSNPTIDNVKSRNIVCFAMKDKFGNYNIETEIVNLDAGNTMWKPAEITTIPNSLYASEIEQTGDTRSGSGNVEFGMIANFEYIGPGTISHLDSFRISKDSKLRTGAKFSIDTSRLNYRLDKDTGRMLIYVPVIILEQGIEPLDYPSELEFNFEADVRYSIDDLEIPIDEANPIYFKTTINIERPLDHTKWLTPAMIIKWQKYLNTSIEYTTIAKEYLGYASIVGVVSCTGMKFWHAAEYTQIALMDDEAEQVEAKADADQRLYMVCDRVASTASPYECDDKFNSDYFLSKEDVKAGFEVQRAGEVVGNIIPNIGGECDSNGDGTRDGVYVSGEGNKFKDESAYGVVRTVESEVYYQKQCLQVDKTKTPAEINFTSFSSNMCYSPGAPNFDETRCNFFGMDEEGVPGKDPATSIISSIRCGAITDTYSHTKNFLKIQESIYDCLEQAKIGDIKGSYCERLMGQAVCDIATNVILPEFQQNIDPRKGASKDDVERNPFTSFLGQVKANEKAFDDRYSGTLFSESGLGTDQLINKACIGALTGDWSVLTDNVLSSIEQNEVEPSFGPPFAESRLNGYNPITGDLSINYRFTYSALSGGQKIDTEIEFICDINAANGEYCPEDGIVSAENVAGSTINTKRIYVSAGASKQETVVVLDEQARFWYNKIKMTHTYKLRDETQIETREFPIIHKSETLIASCYFTAGTMGAGAGWSCDSLFDKDALISAFSIDKSKTKLLPEGQSTFFPGNSVFMNLVYSVKNVDTFSQDVSLAYMTVCNEGRDTAFYILNSAGSSIISTQTLDTVNPNYLGSDPIKLYDELPELESQTVGEYTAILTGFEYEGHNALKFSNSLGLEGAIQNIKRIEADGVLIDKSNFIIPQNLNVNNAGTENYILIPFTNTEFGTLEGKTIKEFKIIFSKKPENILVTLVKTGGTNGMPYEDESNGFTIQDGIATAGPCKVYMRILPSEQAAMLTKDNFKTYNPLAADGETSSIETNVDISDIIEKTFQFSKNTVGVNVNYFSVVKPVNGKSVCLGINDGVISATSIDIPIEFIGQSTGDIVSGSVDFKLSNQNVEIIGSELSKDIVKGLDNNKYEISLNLEDNPNLKKLLLGQNSDSDLASVAEGHVFGTAPSIELILRYTYTLNNQYTPNTLNKDTTKEKTGSGEVKFYLTANENCYEVVADDNNGAS